MQLQIFYQFFGLHVANLSQDLYAILTKKIGRWEKKFVIFQ